MQSNSRIAKDAVNEVTLCDNALEVAATDLGEPLQLPVAASEAQAYGGIYTTRSQRACVLPSHLVTLANQGTSSHFG